MFETLATRIYSHRSRVLITAVLGAVLAGAFGFGVTGRLSPYGADDPATQSVQAKERFQLASGRQIDAGIVALVDAGPVGSPAARRTVRVLATQLATQPDVARVLSYYTTHDRTMVSRDGRSTYVLVYFRPLSDKKLQDAAKTIQGRFAGRRDVLLGGAAIANAQVNTQVSHDLGHAELLAFPFIFLLSLLFFRSGVAAMLPPLLGGLAIVTTFLALRVVSGFVDLSVFAVNFVTGMGLGLAIDYSLFMVSRYREEAALSGYGAPALSRTLRTAGRTIVFSSLTIAAAVASLAVFPQRFLYSMGIAGAMVALAAAGLALTVLPALLAALGPRLEWLSPARLQRASAREARPSEQGGWYRLSRFVMRRPAQIAVASAAVLIALGIPFAHLRLIEASERVLPAAASAHQVGALLDRDFEPNTTSPLELVVGAPASSHQVRQLAARVRLLPGAAAVTAPRPAGAGLALLAVVPRDGPLTAGAQRLVKQVRAIREPFYVGVTGQTASFVDLKHSLAAHMPVVLAIVVGATLLILFLMTGSVLLPVKAVLMNALGLSAMFGILVLIFQDGHLESLLSFQSEGALDATQPIFLFAVGFGLATDYGVFLLSRIKEARDRGASNSESVAMGLERTGRIVTAAALLFAVAIGAFATSQIVFIKQLGVGAALAVLIDASVIRALLVPALMKLLGQANWWAPRPLRRLHDRIGLSEAAPAAGEPAFGVHTVGSGVS